jgi:hypothetical protein
MAGEWPAGLVAFWLAAAAAVLVAAAIVTPSAHARPPSPTPLALTAGDVRAADAPGLAGGPLEVLLLVVILGVVTAAVTALLARALGARHGPLGLDAFLRHLGSLQGSNRHGGDDRDRWGRPLRVSRICGCR